MFRAGLTVFRRLIFAAMLLALLVCGAEVAVRLYEVSTGQTICAASDLGCTDPSKLSVESGYCHQELKLLATAKVTCKDRKQDVEVRTNSLGLRGAEPIDPKPDNVCRIVVLGDETIFAPETPESEHFCTLLQNHLQEQTRIRIEVINAGIPGHCPMTEYLFFKRHLRNLQPDLVLLHFDWSDIHDDRQLRPTTRSDDSQIPLACPNPKSFVQKKFQRCEAWRRQFRLLDWCMVRLSSNWKQQLVRQKSISREVDVNPYSWLREENPEENMAFELARRPIHDLAQLCRASHCSFAVMTSPKPWQVSAKCSSGQGVRQAAGVAREACYTNRAPFEVLAGFLDREKIPFIDPSSNWGVGKKSEARYLRHAPRWSAEGHRQIAKSVATFLTDNVPGAWNSSYFQQNEQAEKNKSTDDAPIRWVNGEKSLRTETDR